MRKTNLLILFLLLIAGGLNAQEYKVEFTYDDAGNRKTREIVEITLKSTKETISSNTVHSEEELIELEEGFIYRSLADINIKVFPNPSKGELKIRLENTSSVEGIKAQLYNTTGHLLECKKLQDSYSSFDMLDYPPGIYILKVTKNNEHRNFKIIKE